jgi:phospholipase C
MARFLFRPCMLLVLWATFALNLQTVLGQTYTPPPHFDHIVIIIQENRTPDDLFGGDPLIPSSACGGFNGFTQYIDLANGGPNDYSGIKQCSFLTSVPDLNTGGGTHSNKDWQGQYNNGALDGACNPVTDPTAKCGQATVTPNPPYVFPAQSTVQPYLDIANEYGWANYMFQTNEGPSFPAHQFLFGGTSTPVWPTQQYADYFVADNGSVKGKLGCPISVPKLPWVDPTGDPSFDYPTPKSLGVSPYECYDHNTMVTTQNGPPPNATVSPRMDKAGQPITWRYYAEKPGILWDAPEANPQTCYGQSTAPEGNPACSGSEFSHVKFPGTMNGQSAPIFNDIQNCDLPKITWVTPDGRWSDHPKDLKKTDKGYPALGPSWVADIIDAIGQSSVNSGGECDYWNTEPTAIFVTWDDWGGFFDHVPPPYVARGTIASCITPNGNNWGCGYTYGFRVPLLVVSPYTKAATVSGPLTPGAPFPPPYSGPYTAHPYPNPCWIHDFGSILEFTEQNFYPAGSTFIAPSPFTYADANSFDSVCNGQAVVPLWEFFNSSTILPFTTIPAPHPASFFQNYFNTTNADGTYPKPLGADDDGDEN